MRKLLALLAVLILTVGLVACGDDKKDEEKPDESADAGETEGSEDEGEEAGSEDAEGEDNEEGSSDGEFSSNEKFNELLTLLNDNGMDVKVVSEGNVDVVGATDGVMAEINGEDLFTFEAFEVEEGHENLAQVEETGEVTMDFEGMEGEVPAWSKGNFVFMLAEGHENYDEIVELIENEFDVE